MILGKAKGKATVFEKRPKSLIKWSQNELDVEPKGQLMVRMGKAK